MPCEALKTKYQNKKIYLVTTKRSQKKRHQAVIIGEMQEYSGFRR
jgi:hypothetical protein